MGKAHCFHCWYFDTFLGKDSGDRELISGPGESPPQPTPSPPAISTGVASIHLLSTWLTRSLQWLSKKFHSCCIKRILENLNVGFFFTSFGIFLIWQLFVFMYIHKALYHAYIKSSTINKYRYCIFFIITEVLTSKYTEQ